MYSKREIVEMIYRPQDLSILNESDKNNLIESFLRWSDEKLNKYFNFYTGNKLDKIGSQYIIVF